MIPTDAVEKTVSSLIWNGSSKAVFIFVATVSEARGFFEARKNDGKFITAEARQGIAFAQAARNPFTGLFQQLVARVMTEAVVDLFEVIKVNEQQANMQVITIGLFQCL